MNKLINFAYRAIEKFSINIVTITHKKKIADNTSDNILIIYLHHLGDIVNFTDALVAIKETSKKQISLVTFTSNKEYLENTYDKSGVRLNRDINVLYLREHPHVNEYLTLIKNINKINYELVLVPIWFGINCKVAYCAGTKELWTADLHFRKGILNFFDNIYLKKATIVKEISDKIWIQNLFSIAVRDIFDKNYRSNISEISIDSQPEDIKNFVVISPGSKSGAPRCWGERKYAQITEYLIKKYDLNVVIVGTKNERSIGENILNNVSDETAQRIYNEAGETDYKGLANLLVNSEFVISNDSGTAHLATALGTRAVVILAKHMLGYNFPYDPEMSNDRPLPICVYSEKTYPCERCGFHGDGIPGIMPDGKSCIGKDGTFRCIDEIAVSDVEKKIDCIMNE